MYFTICTILQVYGTILLATETGNESRLYSSRRQITLLSLRQRIRNEILSRRIVTRFGFCLRLDESVGYLVYSPQNVRLFTLSFCFETEKCVDSSLVCM